MHIKYFEMAVAKQTPYFRLAIKVAPWALNNRHCTEILEYSTKSYLPGFTWSSFSLLARSEARVNSGFSP
jgi:hypothetical protein